MESVNRSKLGADWRNNTAANEPGQLSQRPVGEGMMIGEACINLIHFLLDGELDNE